MPRIYLPPRKKYIRESRPDEKKDNDNHRYVYNTTTWRLLRLKKLHDNPLCEQCQDKGIIRSASEVDHIIPISNGKTKIEKQGIGFDIKNLQSLCKECHKAKHRKPLFTAI